MPNLYLLFSHQLTAEQEADARGRWALQQIIPLPQNLQALWSNVPTDPATDLQEFLQPVADWLAQAQPQDVVLLQGDFGATFMMVSLCLQRGLLPVYATTTRSATETTLQDGSVRIERTFRHAGFRSYVPWGR